MKKVTSLPPEILETLPDKQEDNEELFDGEFFVGLCFEEVKYLCDSIGLDEFNRMLIALHCYGFTDKQIGEKLQEKLPNLCNKKNIKEVNIKMRRRDIIRRMVEANGENIGVISVLREAFKGGRR